MGGIGPEESEKMSDEFFDQFLSSFEDAVCHCSSIYVSDGPLTLRCELCGRDHQLDPDESLPHGDLDGKEYVYGCRCSQFVRYAKFVFSYRHVILSSLADFSQVCKWKLENIDKPLKEIAGGQENKIDQGGDGNENAGRRAEENALE